jgi:hypothetical protein
MDHGDGPGALLAVLQGATSPEVQGTTEARMDKLTARLDELTARLDEHVIEKSRWYINVERARMARSELLVENTISKNRCCVLEKAIEAKEKALISLVQLGAKQLGDSNRRWSEKVVAKDLQLARMQGAMGEMGKQNAALREQLIANDRVVEILRLNGVN